MKGIRMSGCSVLVPLPSWVIGECCGERGGIGVEGCLCGALLGPEGSREFVSSGASVPRLRLLGGVASFVSPPGLRGWWWGVGGCVV
jgi:hypothetical protein